MKKTINLRPMKVTCYVALVFVALFLWGYAYQMYYHYPQIVHTEGTLHTYRMFLFYGLYISKFLLFASCAMFAFVQLRGIKRDVLFPSTNVVFINAVALFAFLSSLFDTNIKEVFMSQVSSNNGEFELTADSIGILLVLLIFAQVYRIAGNVARENALTI